MSDYEYDIFISHRRLNSDWVRWTRDNFLRPLQSFLYTERGEVNIFFDDQIETGVSWPSELARAHARSRVMIAILSPQYFISDWCRLELSLMLHRESKNGMRCKENNGVLVLPVVILDGECFPPEVQKMKHEKIHSYFNPWLRPDGSTQEIFAQHLRDWCPRVQAALADVPPYDPAWENIAHTQFERNFSIKVERLKTPPLLSLMPPSRKATR